VKVPGDPPPFFILQAQDVAGELADGVLGAPSVIPCWCNAF
jgi:hypothetical protein